MSRPHFVDQFDLETLYLLSRFSHSYTTTVRINPSQLLQRKVYVHWIKDERRSVACTGERCPLCADHGKEPRVYAPGLEWHYKRRMWERRIIPINRSCLHILEMELRALTFDCVRTYKANNAPVKMSVRSMGVQPPDVPDFDITPTLLRMWGCQTRVE